jgi:small-conductance mechanosensitive channel
MFPAVPAVPAAKDFAYVEEYLAGPRGMAELAIVLACFAAAWLVDRRFARADRGTPIRGAREVAHVLFPLTALVLLLIARSAFVRSGTTMLFDVAIPLAVALAVIRILVYTLRRLFPDASWLAGSSRAIAFAIWGFLVLHYLGIGAEIVGYLDAISVPLGRGSVSLATIGRGLVVVGVTVAATLWLSGFLERRLMSTGFDPNVRVVVSRFLRALLVIVGVLVSLPALGIDLTLLSVFGGALGVGIGLGLQKLAANYIAGFTILLDKSIELGDLVTVDNRTGVVASVTSRYVVVRGLDGIEAIVPNETLVTTTVLNHSSSVRQARVAVQVRIAYGSDVERALALLEDAARAEPRVLTDPSLSPRAFVAALGDFGIDLELGVWIADPEGGQLGLRSAIHRRILRSFAEAGIEIPFPIREVRILGAVAPDAPKP